MARPLPIPPPLETPAILYVTIPRLDLLAFDLCELIMNIMNRYANCTSMSDLYPLVSLALSLTGLRMLEDPTYASIVRWGDEGDSFVVLEVG